MSYKTKLKKFLNRCFCRCDITNYKDIFYEESLRFPMRKACENEVNDGYVDTMLAGNPSPTSAWNELIAFKPSKKFDIFPLPLLKTN